MDFSWLNLVLSGVEAAGTIMQGVAAKREAKGQAQYEELRADVTRRTAEAQARQLGRQQIRDRGRELAAMAQSGFTTGGNFVDLLEQADVDRELDIMNTMYQGELAAIGLDYQAKLDRARGRQALASGITQGLMGFAGDFIGQQTPTSQLDTTSSRSTSNINIARPVRQPWQ